MSIFRFFMLLSLVLWMGGILFFGAVVAPALFSMLPSRHLAGSVASRILASLHWMGVISGIAFALTSMAHSRLASGAAHPFAARHTLVYVMIALTIFSQFVLSARMNTLRLETGEINRLPQNDSRRIEFDNLHLWSTRVEMTVLTLGLLVIYLTARTLR